MIRPEFVAGTRGARRRPGRRHALGMVIGLALALLGLAAPPAVAAPLKEVALVIGNGGYQRLKPLNNPVNDATLVAQSLQAVGFQLVGGGVKSNLDRPAMLQAIQDLTDAAQDADVVVIYYAGHGVQVSGSNYLIPVDMAQPSSTALLAEEAVSLDTFLSVFKSLPKSQINLLMLDACRDSPFPQTGARGLNLGGGLAYVNPEGSNVIWFATQPGLIAADGSGANGPYAQAIAQILQQPGISSNDVFDQFGSLVMQMTNGEQTPTASANPAKVKFIFKGPDGRGAFQPYPINGLMIAQATGPSASRSVDPDGRPPGPSDANAVDSPTPETRRQALQRIFGGGFAFSAESGMRRFDFGMTLEQVEDLLDGRPKLGLAQAGEYRHDRVFYFWRHFSYFPSLSTAFAHLDSQDHCIAPDAQIVFFFKNDRLFHVSLRFVKSDACPAYDWLKTDLMGDLPDHLVLSGPNGPTDLIYNDTPSMTILEITQRGVADDAASIFPG